MADNWRILDLGHFNGELRFNSSTRRLLAIEEETGEIAEFALRDVGIVFIGIKVRMSHAVMQHLAQSDVVVLFCDWKGMPVSGVYPWLDAHGRVAARQRAQANLSVPRMKNAWMRIVKAKIRGQEQNLRYLGSNQSDSLRNLEKAVKSGDPDNREAQAAKRYWSALFPDEGFSRAPGGRGGGRNSLLDYAYTILRGHCMRAVLSAGLTPALGIYHRGRGNAFALADDLIEPFRPAIDLTVAQMPKEAECDDESIRRILLESTLQTFCADGRTIPAAMTDLAQCYGKYAEGEIDRLEVPFWNPALILKRKNDG